MSHITQHAFSHPCSSPLLLSLTHSRPPRHTHKHTLYQQPRYLDRNCACTPQPGAEKGGWWRAHAFSTASPHRSVSHAFVMIIYNDVLIPRFFSSQYGLGFYFNYLSRWPDMCCTAQHPSGRLMGYGALPLPFLFY